MKITLPGKVTEIIENLQMHGYEAYAVGGCVRDSILAKELTKKSTTVYPLSNGSTFKSTL